MVQFKESCKICKFYAINKAVTHLPYIHYTYTIAGRNWNVFLSDVRYHIKRYVDVDWPFSGRWYDGDRHKCIDSLITYVIVMHIKLWWIALWRFLWCGVKAITCYVKGKFLINFTQKVHHSSHGQLLTLSNLVIMFFDFCRISCSI